MVGDLEVGGFSFSGGVTNSGTISGGRFGIQVDQGLIFGGGITNSGMISYTLVNPAGAGIFLEEVSSFSGGIINTGTIAGDKGIFVFQSGAVSIFDSGVIIGTGGTAVDLRFNAGGNTFTLGPGYSITGLVKGQGADTFQLGGVGAGAFDLSTIGTQYTGFTTFNVVSGTWTVSNTGAQSWSIAGGATLQLGPGGGGLQPGAITGNITDNGTFAVDRSDTYTYAGTISGSGTFVQMGSGITVLTGSNSYTGPTAVNAGTLRAGAAGAFASGSAFTVASGAVLDLNGVSQTIGSLAGAGNVTLGSATLAAGGNNASTTYSGSIGGSGGFTKTGTGTLDLTGTNSYTGVTNINGGILQVDGAITSSSAVNVNAGGALTGTGTIDPTVIMIGTGGTFAPGTPGAPGTSTTIAGNLAFQGGASYVVSVNTTTSSFATVTGTAALNGTVDAIFAPGRYLTKTYDILQSAGLNDTTFSGLVTANLPTNFLASLSYTSTDVLLDLQASLPTQGLNANQGGVANAINGFFNGGGAVPAGFANLFNLTGAGLAHALTPLAGENATGAEHGAFQLTNEFLALMLDPFADGRGAASGGGPLGFAEPRDTDLPGDATLAYAGILKAPARPPPTFEQRWTQWGTAFGGSGTASGDPTTGSTNVTASTYGFATGADARVGPDTVLGFALAGSGTHWSLAQALGTGNSDAFQAGVYGTRYFGPAYLGAAFAFTNNWFTTNRNALGDQLTARFQGQSYGARLEGGYRFAAASATGITPYAAIQVQDFRTPTYGETDLTGGGFGLTYNSMTATDTRSEVGARFDARTVWGAMPLQLRARLAWAHDWVSNPALNAAFEQLPGTSFTVNGAPVPRDSALTSAGAQLFITPSWSLLAKFDGEFAQGSQTYAGSGTVRYTW